MNNKKQIIALIVLGIVAVISLIYGVTSGPKAKTLPAQNMELSPLPSGSAELAAPIRRRAKLSSFKTWNRSPFIPKGIKGSSSGLVLSGILGSAPNLKAMINGEVVGKGGRIGPNTVVSITSDGVVLNDGTKDFTLKIEG